MQDIPSCNRRYDNFLNRSSVRKIAFSTAYGFNLIDEIRERHTFPLWTQIPKGYRGQTVTGCSHELGVRPLKVEPDCHFLSPHTHNEPCGECNSFLTGAAVTHRTEHTPLREQKHMKWVCLGYSFTDTALILLRKRP